MAERKSKSEGLDLRVHDFKRKYLSRNRHRGKQSERNSDGSIRSASRYFRPAPLRLSRPLLVKAAAPSIGRLTRDGTSPRRRRLRSHTLRGESSSLARCSRPAFPRSASGAAMAATAMGGASVVGAPKFFAAGSRRTVRGTSALRAATRPAAARRSIATVTRAQAGQTAEGENPAPRDPRPLTPRAPGTRSPSFRFFSRPALSDLFPRGPRVPVHSRF